MFSSTPVFNKPTNKLVPFTYSSSPLLCCVCVELCVELIELCKKEEGKKRRTSKWKKEGKKKKKRREAAFFSFSFLFVSFFFVFFPRLCLIGWLVNDGWAYGREEHRESLQNADDSCTDCAGCYRHGCC